MIRSVPPSKKEKMRTVGAFFGHVGLGALQVALANSNLLPLPVQLPIQALGLALHGYMSVKNSNSDPNGNILYKIGGGAFKSIVNTPNPEAQSQKAGE